MPAELENTSITFTDEAETALSKRLLRFERELRGRAIDEAVRTRGIPAEVTGSDVQRAFDRMMTRRFRTARDVDRTFAFHPGAHMTREFSMPGLDLRQRALARRSLSERVANLYMWLGVVLAVVGVMWAPIYHRVKDLSSGDPIWRFGLLLAGGGLATFLVGVLARLFFTTRLRLERTHTKTEPQ
jgi:hypothetical protein